MYLKKISLFNYKNFAEAEFEFDYKINCFVGKNGVGKTNVLDAIYHLAYGKSYFNPLTEQEGRRFVPLFTEKVSLTWALSYEIPNWFLNLDYTGSYTGSMRLPLLSPLDPRREYSLPYSIQNIQITYKKFHNVELFGGVKNLLNWTPNRGNPFLIARAHDPFDKQVTFDSNGVAQPTPDNPYALTFDPTYAYGPNQGIRAFVGLRWHLD